MTREKATRRISLTASASHWSELLKEIDQLGSGDRFHVELTDDTVVGPPTHQMAALIGRGYSWSRDGTADPVSLVPSPSRVLYVVAPSDDTDRTPDWIGLVPADHFRQHVLALHSSDEAFARLQSSCAGESWHLDRFLPEQAWAQFVMEFVASREIDVVQVVAAPLGVDLVPALRAAFPTTRVVVDVDGASAQDKTWCAYVTSRYANVIDAYCASTPDVAAALESDWVSTALIHLIGGTDRGIAAQHEDIYGRLIAATVG